MYTEVDITQRISERQ